MKIRGLLSVGAAVATVTCAALAVQGSAVAATSASSAATSKQTTASPHPVSPSTFRKASGQIAAGRPSGITPTTNQKRLNTSAGGLGVRAAGPAAAATAACAEPNCNLAYQGGLVQHAPQIYLVFWGANWTSTGADQTYITNFYSGLGSSGDTWSSVTSQYGDGTGTAHSPAVVAGSWNDTTNAVPGSVHYADLATEANNAYIHFNIADTNDAQIVIMTQAGTCYADESSIGLGLFAGSCGQVQVPTANGPLLYCGYHSSLASSTDSTFLPFVVLPYQPDAGTECGQNFVNTGSAGTFDGFSVVGGHEYAETITDPNQSGSTLSTLGWVDLNDNVSGGEIGDKCAWGGEPWGGHDPFGNVTLSTGKFAMQSLWANGTSVGRCVMTPPTLTVATPPTQTATLGHAVSLQIGVTTNTGAQTFKATGLPSGLSINSSTGKITGTPNTTAGVSNTTVTVSDWAKSASVKFSWQVSSAPGSVVGYGSKCVDDYYGRTTTGNKIDLYSCSGSAPQQITFTYQHHLVVQGNCISAGAIYVYLYPCSTATNRAWTRESNGEYRSWSTNKCLTDPGNSTTNGIQLVVANCANTANQHWGLPVSLVGAIRGYASKCVDDYFGRTTSGNKIDLYSCTGGAPQRITLKGNQLQVMGNFCITAGSIYVYLYPCTNSTSKTWTFLPSGQWLNAGTNKCLTDPNNSTTNGVQLQVATCRNTANQHWTLP